MNDTDSSEATCEVPDDQKRLIRAVLFSQWGIPLDSFSKSYHELEGTWLPYRSWGFSTLRQCLESIPDVVRFEFSEDASRWILYAVADDKSFMSSFTAKKQLSNSSAGLPGRSRNGRRNNRTTGRPREKGASGPRKKADSEEDATGSDDFPGLVLSQRGLFTVLVRCEEEELDMKEITKIITGVAPIAESNCLHRINGNYLFFRYKEKKEAVAVIRKFNGYLYKGKKLCVRPAEEKKPDKDINKIHNVNGGIPPHPSMMLPLHPVMVPPYPMATPIFAPPMAQPFPVFPPYPPPVMLASPNARGFTVEKPHRAHHRREGPNQGINGMKDERMKSRLPHPGRVTSAQKSPEVPPGNPSRDKGSNRSNTNGMKDKRVKSQPVSTSPKLKPPEGPSIDKGSNGGSINGMKDERVKSRLSHPEKVPSALKSPEGSLVNRSRNKGSNRSNTKGIKERRVKSQPVSTSPKPKPPEGPSIDKELPPPLLDCEDGDCQENGIPPCAGPPPLLEESDSESDWSDGEGPKHYTETQLETLPNGVIEGAAKISLGRGRGLTLFQSR